MSASCYKERKIRKASCWKGHALRSCATLVQAETLGDKRIVVAIDSWEADSAYPAGHYVRTLGTIGDRETETEVRMAHCSPKMLPSVKA